MANKLIITNTYTSTERRKCPVFWRMYDVEEMRVERKFRRLPYIHE